MKIQSSKRRHWLVDYTSARLRGRGRRFWATLLYTIVVFVAGALIHRSGVFGDLRPLATHGLTTAKHKIQGWLADPERITIDIGQIDFMKLAHERTAAIQNKILLSSAADYVPAAIRHEDQNLRVKLRLKGDLVDHLRGKKWSYRVIVRGNHTLFGMKQFSLQHPGTRNYLFERIYHQALRREGVLALRYEFVDVTVNGKPMGVYALEEHFEKRLIEHNRRREGPIVRFNENLFWSELDRQKSVPIWQRDDVTGTGSFSSSDVDGFQTQEWLSDPERRDQYLSAIRLLEAFQQGRVTTSEAFDTEKLATFFAISDLLGAKHGAGEWTNARFYYNPITSRLEPIGYDAYDRGMAEPSLLALKGGNSGYPAIFFRDTSFYERYLRALARVSEPSYVDSLIADLTPDVESNLRILYRDFPNLKFSWNPVRLRQEFIRNFLYPTKGVHAYRQARHGHWVELELANIQYLPVHIERLITSDSVDLLPQENTVVLAGKQPDSPLTYRAVAFSIPDGLTLPENDTTPWSISYRVLGTRRSSTATVFPFPHTDSRNSPVAFMRRKPNAGTFPFVQIDQQTRRILIKPGTWVLDRILILPAGYLVVAGPGTSFDLRHGAKMLSYSRLEWRGTVDQPITFSSSDSTGQGLVVLHTDGPSTLEGVRFANLVAPKESGWAVSGAVSFYEAPVYVLRCEFTSNRSEDALNIVRSRFSVDQTRFLDAASDAIDLDFAKGTIRNSAFISSGNDAIDASGSVIEIRNIEIRGAGDKGLSAGETSTLTGRGIEVENAAIAIASKDLSSVRLRRLRIATSDVGLAAYQKKPEFGPGTLKIDSLEIVNVREPYLIEIGSEAIVDGVKMAGSRESVATILYGAELGKRTN